MKLNPLPAAADRSDKRVTHTETSKFPEQHGAMQPLQFYRELAELEPADTPMRQRQRLMIWISRAEKQMIVDHAATYGRNASQHIRITMLEAAINEARKVK